jgi:hypothetical protein
MFGSVSIFLFPSPTMAKNSVVAPLKSTITRSVSTKTAVKTSVEPIVTRSKATSHPVSASVDADDTLSSGEDMPIKGADPDSDSDQSSTVEIVEAVESDPEKELGESYFLSHCLPFTSATFRHAEERKRESVEL